MQAALKNHLPRVVGHYEGEMIWAAALHDPAGRKLSPNNAIGGVVLIPHWMFYPDKYPQKYPAYVGNVLEKFTTKEADRKDGHGYVVLFYDGTFEIYLNYQKWREKAGIPRAKQMWLNHPEVCVMQAGPLR